MRVIVYDNSETIYNEELPVGIAFDEQIDDTAITYYNPDFYCKKFDNDRQAEGFLSVLLKDSEVNRDSLIAFLDKMAVVVSESDTLVQLIARADNLLFTSNYPPEWKVGLSLVRGDVVKYNDKWYEVIQSHTTQADWTPDKTPALFNVPALPGEIPVWKQPAGAHDAYKKGDQVYFPTDNDSVYESLIDANVWSPSVYPAGWKKLKIVTAGTQRNEIMSN
jgi:hypothetical protein